MPALPLDAALVHLNRADAAGNAQFLGPDLYFDDLFCTAAEQAYVSCERIVPTEELRGAAGSRRCASTGGWSHGVVEAPNGAHFTSCAPDYERDEEFQRDYAAAAEGSGDLGARSRPRTWSGSEADYQRGGRGRAQRRSDRGCGAAAR